MRFYNYSGPKTKDEVLTIIDDHINAYKALKKVGINNHIFENGDAGWVDVVKEFKNLKCLCVSLFIITFAARNNVLLHNTRNY